MTPAVLTHVQQQMRVVCQETFAPIVTVQTYETLDEALRRANDSEFGLQAGIFTGSLAVALAAARGLQVGGVMVNDTSFYRAGQMPYGGVKRSGMGHEGPRYAIEEMTELRKEAGTYMRVQPQKWQAVCNLVPLPYRRVSVQPYHGPMTVDAIT